MENAPLTFSTLFAAVLGLWLLSSSASGQGMPRRPVNDPTHPLSNDPRTPRQYDLEKESGNGKIRQDVETAFEGG
ncbi:MAG: hypothetical protein ABR568_14155 [Pyrinomonadaceae bacterium]